MIFTTSFGYMNATVKVAQSFPNVIFEHATGYKTAKNLGVYEARFYEGAYLLGVIAGKMTKTNTLGYRGFVPDPGSGPQHQRVHAGRQERQSRRSRPR